MAHGTPYRLALRSTTWPSAEPATDGAWQWGPASTSGDRTDCRVSVLAAWVAEATRPPAAITPLGERRGCPRCGDPAFVDRPGSELNRLDELADDLARVVMIGGMTYPNHPRPYDPYPGQEPPRAAIVCPKCHGAMRTYERNGIQLEQCGSCRGLFLDFGELEHLTQMEGRFVSQAPPPPGYGPAWGKHGDRRYRKGGLAGLFFSS